MFSVRKKAKNTASKLTELANYFSNLSKDGYEAKLQPGFRAYASVFKDDYEGFDRAYKAYNSVTKTRLGYIKSLLPWTAEYRIKSVLIVRIRKMHKSIDSAYRIIEEDQALYVNQKKKNKTAALFELKNKNKLTPQQRRLKAARPDDFKSVADMRAENVFSKGYVDSTESIYINLYQIYDQIEARGRKIEIETIQDFTYKNTLRA